MVEQAAETADRVKSALDAVPPGVTVMAAARERSLFDVEAITEARIMHVGRNYLQEAADTIPDLDDQAIATSRRCRH